MIGDFIIEKMAGYISGGMNPVTAAVFTRGELEAIYKGNHYSRDKSGAMRVTPPPEALDTEAAVKKADQGITEILNYCDEQARKETPKAVPARAPEGNKIMGFEKMNEYARSTA
jgi:hypothetical protein